MNLNSTDWRTMISEKATKDDILDKLIDENFAQTHYLCNNRCLHVLPTNNAENISTGKKVYIFVRINRFKEGD